MYRRLGVPLSESHSLARPAPCASLVARRTRRSLRLVNSTGGLTSTIGLEERCRLRVCLLRTVDSPELSIRIEVSFSLRAECIVVGCRLLSSPSWSSSTVPAAWFGWESEVAHYGGQASI